MSARAYPLRRKAEAPRARRSAQIVDLALHRAVREEEAVLLEEFFQQWLAALQPSIDVPQTVWSRSAHGWRRAGWRPRNRRSSPYCVR